MPLPPADAPDESPPDPAQLALRLALYEDAFHALPNGILLLDGELRVLASNARYRMLWDYPTDLLAPGRRFADVIRYSAERGDYGDIDPDVMITYVLGVFSSARSLDDERKLADGRVIEIKGSRRPDGGFVLTYLDVTGRRALEEELKRLATSDSLTGIANRRHFLTLAGREWQRSKRYDRPLTLLLLDIDHFKRINDRLGHAMGDAAIRSVVAAVTVGLRASDLIGRVGGEEFAILLPETAEPAALQLAERIRRNVAERPLTLATIEPLTLTVSLGVARLQAQDVSFDDLFQRADAALLQAKQDGRDRVKAG